MPFSPRHVALLGLLDFDDSALVAPTGTPNSIERRGHWQVEHHSEISVWRCLCRRSDPLLTTADCLHRVRLPHDLIQGCEVCRNELALATTKSAQLRAWLERNRHTIDPVADLDYLEDYGYVVFNDDEERKQRTKRFIYETFFKKELNSSSFVSSVCSNPSCINPYHLCVKSAANQKVTPAMRKAVEHLQTLGISAKITQRVIADKFGTKLSLSTIQGLRAATKQLLSTVG